MKDGVNAGDESTMHSVQTRMVQRIPDSPPARETPLFASKTNSVTNSRGIDSVHRDKARSNSPRGLAEALTYHRHTFHYPSPRSGRPVLYQVSRPMDQRRDCRSLLRPRHRRRSVPWNVGTTHLFVVGQQSRVRPRISRVARA